MHGTPVKHCGVGVCGFHISGKVPKNNARKNASHTAKGVTFFCE